MILLFHMYNTISARQIQRAYKKVLEAVDKSAEPFVIISNNKPVAAIINIRLLEKIERNHKLDQLVAEGMKEYKAGRTTSISTPEELKTYIKEIRKDVKEYDRAKKSR